MKTRLGTMDEYVVKEMQRDPYHVRGIVKDGDVVLDCGANIGAFASFVLSIAPNAKLICVEPMPSNAEACRVNLAKEQNCVVLQAAIMGTAGTITLQDFGDEQSACHSVMDYGVKGLKQIAVPAVTLDDIMSGQHIGLVQLLKLDVQGAEFDIFKHCSRETIDRMAYISMEIHPCIVGEHGFAGHLQGCEQKVRALLKTLSQTHFLVHGDPRHDRLSVVQWKNRRLATYQERLRSSCRLSCRFLWQKCGFKRLVPGVLAERMRGILSS